LDLDLIGNTLFTSIAPNLKTQRAMEGRRKTSKPQMLKNTMLGLFHSHEGNAFARESC
jgi:hypothetical protein